MTRLFVTAWPPAAVVDHVRSIDRTGWKGVRWVPEVNWHVTLRFIGEADDAGVRAALAASTLPTATATVDASLELLDRSSLVVPVHGLSALASAVVDATRDIGRVERGRGFRGHLTVGRSKGKRPIVFEPSSHVGAAQRASITFEVGEVALVASELTPSGARYTTVATFTTSAGGAR